MRRLRAALLLWGNDDFDVAQPVGCSLRGCAAQGSRMIEALILGALQGVSEWLPVSSQGVVTAAGARLFSLTSGEALAFALWLHLGTALAALAYLRREALELLREAAALPRKPSPLLAFALASTAVSSVIGLPLLLLLDGLPAFGGGVAMAGVGALMLATGALQLRRPPAATRGRDVLTLADGVAAGVAQGFAALPGLSRSGLTVAFLLARRVDRRDALALSFLIGIPASVGASAFAAMRHGSLAAPEGAAGLAAALALGLLTIRALMAVAERVRFGPFVVAAGFALTLGGAWEAFAG